jgi:hypothetical protein
LASRRSAIARTPRSLSALLSLRASKPCIPWLLAGRRLLSHRPLVGAVESNPWKKSSPSIPGTRKELMLTNPWLVWYLLAPHFREIPFPIG